MHETDSFGADGDAIRAWLAKRDSYRAGPTSETRPPGTVKERRGPAPRPGGPRPDATTAARSVLDSLRGDAVADVVRAPDEAPAPQPLPRRAPEPARPAAPPPPVPAAEDVRRPRWTEPEEPDHVLDASTDVIFPARTGIRTTLSVLLLAAGAAVVVTSLVAVKQKDENSVIIAAVVGVLALVVWGVRAGATPTALEINRGQLYVRRGTHTEVVDLTSEHTPVAVVGEPGLRGWSVLVERPDSPLLVIDASIVDPYWFTTALYRVRPGLRPGGVRS